MLFTSIDLEVEVQAQDEGSGYGDGVNLEVNPLLAVLEQLDINQELDGQEVSVLLDHIHGVMILSMTMSIHEQISFEVILNCLKRNFQ